MTLGTQSNPIELDLVAPSTTVIVGGLLRQALHSGKLALLFGSAISQFKPTSIPTASFVSNKLRDMMADRFSPYASKSDVLWGIEEMPFEIFMSRLAELVGPSIPEKFTRELVEIQRVNPVHRQIGALVDICNSKGLELAIVTPNYDLGIELSVSAGLQKVVEETDLNKAHSSPVRLFKPHGSIDVKGSLVFDADREDALPEWKLRYLQTLLGGKVLLVLGYSGWDLDISQALNRCDLDTVIWCCHKNANADTRFWSPGARGVIHNAASYKLILNASKRTTRQRNILRVLEPISPGLSQIRYSRIAAEARLMTALSGLPQGVQDAWSAWTITRAGYGHIGLAAKDLLNQVKAMSPAGQAEYIATCYFYQGCHATAARKEGEAASLAGNDIIRRTYHRANQAGFWNRGHYSPQAFIAILRGVYESCFMLFQKSERSQFGSAVTNVLDQGMQIWPLYQWLIGRKIGRRIARFLTDLGRRFRGFEEQTISDRFAAIGSGDPREELSKWRYEWLGQRARMINYQRIEARMALDEFRQRNMKASLRRGLELALESALGASHVGDPARLGKAYLLLSELSLEARITSLPFNHTIPRQIGIGARSWDDLVYEFGARGWSELRASETWGLSIWPGIWFYSLATGSARRVLGERTVRLLITASTRWAGA